MTNESDMEQILRLAIECGAKVRETGTWDDTDASYSISASGLSAFARKIRESEREACAKLCEDQYNAPLERGQNPLSVGSGIRLCRDAIRSRTSP